MTHTVSPDSPSQELHETSATGCFLSVFRLLVGPGLIFATGAALIMNKAPLGSVWDFIFLGAVAATLVVALLAPQKPAPASPQQGDIQPMSRSRYFSLVLGVALAFFCFAHFVAPRVL